MIVKDAGTLTRASSYSTSVAVVARGAPRRGIVHSVFPAAANIIFPGHFILSLNAITSPCMPNGLQLSTPAGTFPFSDLRPGMPVLFGAQRLLIEAVGCSLDLSCCSEWDPHIERPGQLDMKVMAKNKEWLLKHVPALDSQLTWDQPVHNVRSMAQYLCGRGVGLTPAGDDILAGWMAVNWLLYGPLSSFLEACQQIVSVAKQQTHLLSQCWLSYAAAGNVAMPIKALLDALTKEDEDQLAGSVRAVLSLGATSGRDLIQGVVSGLADYPYWGTSSIGARPGLHK